jgi:hypothetical protein
MKTTLILFNLLILSPLLAQDYLMPQLVLKKNLLDKSEINDPLAPNHCQNGDLFSGDNKIQNAFEASIKCKFTCLESGEFNENVIQNFSTEDLEMQRGDGNLWASLTTTLQMWSGETCLKLAQKKCMGLGKVSGLTQPEVTSGKWKMDTRLGCSNTTPKVFSPFEKTIRTQRIRNSISQIPGELEIKTRWHEIKKVTHGGKKYTMPNNCKNIIIGNFCYGDCITLDKGPFKELLSSPAPLGEDKYTFCADELVGKLKGKILSKDVLQFYCDDFFLYNLKKKNATGLTCASSRINADCSKLNF